MPETQISEELLARASKVKLLLLDCDGVLTDGRIYFLPNPDGTVGETKCFCTQDGIALQWAYRHGIETGIISGRGGLAVQERARSAHMKYLFEGHTDKLPLFNQILEESGYTADQIGYVGDYTPLFDNWSGNKNLASFARFYPDFSLDRAHRLAQRLNLNLDQRAKHYSTGQRTKLAIILALSHEPKLLLLDEPTAGLDPVSRDVFMELLFEQMATEQVALLYATHHISEIEQLADRLVFISCGMVVRDEVKEDLAENWRSITFRFEKSLEQIPNVVQHKSEHPYHEIVSEDANSTIQFLTDCGVEGIESSRLSIEKIAVQILKESAKEINHV